MLLRILISIIECLGCIHTMEFIISPKNIPNVCAVFVGKYIILTVEHYKMTENMSI